MLEVQNLCSGYGKKEVVHNVSFSAPQGEFVCIIGANGCGKTTLLKSILGLLAPFSGSVRVNNTETLHLKEKQRAKFFAYIPQAHMPPFPFSVADVIIMGRTPYINRLAVVSDHDKRIAYDAMELLGISNLADATFTQLSGGQQQLVLIARALAQEPDILVMDEPTASLDFGNQQMVLRRMRALADSGTSVLMVTHDPDHALYCASRVIAMQAGKIIGDGTPEEVMTSECLRTIYDTNARILDVEIEPGVMQRVCVSTLRDTCVGKKASDVGDASPVRDTSTARDAHVANEKTMVANAKTI